MVSNNKVDPVMRRLHNIVTNTILKQFFRAERNETEESRYQFFLYENALLSLDNIYDYVLEYDDIKVSAPHLDDDTIYNIIEGYENIADYLPPEMISHLLGIYRNKRISEYVELNNYYRMLMGLPAVEMSESDYILIDDKPIHTLTDIEIYRLKESGELDYYIANYPEHQYLFYLDKRIDFYAARKADVYEVIYIPKSPEFIKYSEYVSKEREVYLRNFTNTAMNRGSDYNEAMEVTVMKMSAMIYFFIDENNSGGGSSGVGGLGGGSAVKNTFSAEEAKNIWREYGMSLPKGMSEDYRNSITYIMNYLTRYKGTNFCVNFITKNIFSGLKLYKYEIRRRIKEGLSYPIPPNKKPEEIYDVDFILRPFNKDDYNPEEDDEERILTYEEVVLMDPRWGDTQELKDAVFGSKFSYVDSKYLSLDNYVDLSKFSENFTIVQRCLLERKQILINESILFSGGTGLNHNLFDLMVYYLAIMLYIESRLEFVAPDTLKKYNKLMGFKVPDNFDEVKEIFYYYLTQHGYNDFIKDFPDALNDNMSFVELLQNIDKAVGSAEMFHDIIKSCHNFPEVDCVTQLYKMIRVVDTSPHIYNMSSGSIDGKSYVEYLRENDLELSKRYEYVVRGSDSTLDLVVSDMDTITQIFMRMFEDYERKIPTLEIDRVKEAFNDANIFVNGISKYLTYVLKMYKAYSTDFIADNNIYQISNEYNYQMNIDQMDIELDFSYTKRMNISQYHRVEYSNTNILYSENVNSCMIVERTPYGDLIIGED